jgi:hypothetical protein
MTAPDPLPPYPYPAPPVDTSSGMTRSTLDNLHGDQGVVLQPKGEPLGPPVTPHGPDMTQPYGPNDPDLARVWVPDHRPLAPGQVLPASAKGDEKNTGGGGDDGHLDVNPADLHQASDEYTELAARVAAISPRAADELARIMATHGVMGYPTAVGIAIGLAAQETALTAKAADFTRYAERFTEHAATYVTVDTESATRYVL